MKKCSICKQDITPEPNGWTGGCNAWPINDGTCCKACDDEVVIPARIAQHYATEIDKNDQLKEIKTLVESWIESGEMTPVNKEKTDEKE